MAFFQMGKLTYNLWHHLQAFTTAEKVTTFASVYSREKSGTFRRHTVHVVGLKVLFIAAKIVQQSEKVKIKS